jgi:hypothetical protein
MRRRCRRALHRLRFNLWLLGARDMDDYAWRVYVCRRMRHELLGGRRQ